MKVYGLKANGISLNGYSFSMYSRNLFLTEEEAKGHEKDFLEKSCDASNFEALDTTEKIKISIITHDLISKYMTPITLTQEESNLLMFCKGHYEGDFWPTIEILYKEYYDMDEMSFGGTLCMVRKLWLKMLEVNPNKERLLEEYEELTLPSNNWRVAGGNQFGGIWYNPEIFKFNDRDLIKARISAMASQLRHIEIKYFDYKKPTTFNGLKLINQ